MSGKSIYLNMCSKCEPKSKQQARSFFSLSIYHGRIQHDVEHNTNGREQKPWSHYELRNDTLYLAFTDK